MNSTFYKLLDNTMAEVCLREPAYPSSFPITVAHEEMASAYSRHPLCENLPPGGIEQALGEGLAYVAKGWTKAKQPSAAIDRKMLLAVMPRLYPRWRGGEKAGIDGWLPLSPLCLRAALDLDGTAETAA